MGSCISKCIPSKEKEHETYNVSKDNNVLVMHEVVLSPRKPRSPPPSCSDSITSFSATTEKSVSSSTSSLSSSASSCASMKDKSFSNEFLLSCVKENPQIICRKEVLRKPNVQVYSPSSLANVQRQKTKVLVHSQRKGGTVGSTPLKRICPNSPNQSRQKRVINYPMRIPPSPLRTPSPSRRFSSKNNDDCNHMRQPSPLRTPSRRIVNNDNRYNSFSCQRKVISNGGSSFCFEKEEAIRGLSPTNNSRTKSGSSTCKQTCSYRVGSKIDELEVAKAMAKQDLDVEMEMESIDNPVITLDCFIFL